MKTKSFQIQLNGSSKTNKSKGQRWNAPEHQPTKKHYTKIIVNDAQWQRGNMKLIAMANESEKETEEEKTSRR